MEKGKTEHKNVERRVGKKSNDEFGKYTNNGILPNLIHEKKGQTNLHYKQMKIADDERETKKFIVLFTFRC